GDLEPREGRTVGDLACLVLLLGRGLGDLGELLTEGVLPVLRPDVRVEGIGAQPASGAEHGHGKQQEGGTHRPPAHMPSASGSRGFCGTRHVESPVEACGLRTLPWPAGYSAFLSFRARLPISR